jgi:hypothetical protein
MQILGLHTIRPTSISRNTPLEQYTDAPSQTHLRDAHHCHGILMAETASMLAIRIGYKS